jgi:hypothetical protein
MWVWLQGYREHTRGKCLGIPVWTIRRKTAAVIGSYCKDNVCVRISGEFWGFLKV